MNYKKTYVPAKGYTPICKIGECSLKKLEFGIIELDAGEKLPFDTEDREVAFIMLEGHCNVSFDGERYENVGNRANVFENRKAESFYMPREQHAFDGFCLRLQQVVAVEKTLQFVAEFA